MVSESIEQMFYTSILQKERSGIVGARDRMQGRQMEGRREVATGQPDDATRRQYIADIVKEWEEILYPETTEALRKYAQELLKKN